MAGVVMAGAVPALAQGGPLGNLRAQYPEARVYEAGERVRTVYGAEMTAGATPRGAADGWVDAHAEVFARGPFRLTPTREFRQLSGTTVVSYKQAIDGVPVEGSGVRVLTIPGDEHRVVYAAARLAHRPDGGLPAPAVSAEEALWIAQGHPAAVQLVHWADPVLVALYTDPPWGTAEASPAWKCAGVDAGWPPAAALTLYVDAVSGGVVRVADNIHRANPVVQGHVIGRFSPGTKPDRDDTGCQNLPVPGDIPFARVRALDPQTGEPIGETFTNPDGSYALWVPGGGTVDVEVMLVGPGWEVTTLCAGTTPCDPIRQVAASVDPPASGVDFELNAGPVEYTTAEMNAHIHLARTRAHFKARTPNEGFYPGLDDPIPTMVNYDGGCGYAAYVHVPGFFGPEIVLGIAAGGCANTAYSTVASHEYGHYLLEFLFELPPGNGFGEGYSDTVAFMVQDTDIMGEDFFSCGPTGHARRPLVRNAQYPVCLWAPPNNLDPAIPHLRGELLGAVWLRLRADPTMEWPTVQQLHADWSFLALPPGADPGCSNQNWDESASVDTLIEVLVVDSPDDDPANAPHLEQICAAFREQNIRHVGLCGESAGGSCFADCDGNGVLDFWDFLCFQNALIAGDPYADCDQDGRLTFFDLLCFQNEFVAGCPR